MKETYLKKDEPKIILPGEIDEITIERENFRNLFRQTPEMVCILSGPDHLFEFVNDAHIKALGFDATGKTVRDAQPESIEVHGILDDVYRTGITAELNELPVTLTDRLRYFNLTYAARRDRLGNINGVMILGTEITDQFLTREILKSQNSALEMTTNGAPLEEVLDVLASAVEKHLGYRVKSSIFLLDNNRQALLHASAPSFNEDYVRAVDGLILEDKKESCSKAACLQKDVLIDDISQEPLWMDSPQIVSNLNLKSCWSKPLFSSNGNLISIFALYNLPKLGLTEDEKQVVDLITQTVALVIERRITAREKNKTDLALSKSRELYLESKEQLSLAVEVAKVGFYDWNVNENKVSFSPQMLKDWGIDKKITKLEEALDCIHEKDRQRVHTLINEALEKDLPYHTEYRVKKSDGNLAWMEVRGQIHRNDQGEPVRFFGTSIEVTDRKRKESKLEEAQLSAESASSAKGLFLANMSHEIRTPLGAIMGFLELLKSPANSHETLLDYIGIIDRNSKQLLRIVDDVLDLSKIEAGKLLIESLEFSLINLLNDFNSLMSFKAREKGLHYEMQIESNLPNTIVGDPTRLRQILSNIVGNAIKFTDKGSVHIIVNFKEPMLTLEVIDTGCGISENAKAHLFQPFSQADNSTTRTYGGTGLGLSLTRRLCGALGGEFHLKESQVDKGSCFVVTLPIVTPKDVQLIDANFLSSNYKSKLGADHSEKVLEGLKILLVEDSPDNQRLFSIILNDLGVRIDLASDGNEALIKVQKKSFDIILMDIQMPNMDGHEATQKLRAMSIETPIIALTAHAMKDEKARCLESGFSDFLSKPIDRKSLLDLILKYHRD